MYVCMYIHLADRSVHWLGLPHPQSFDVSEIEVLLILCKGHTGGGTILQAGSSRVRFVMRSLGCFNLPNPSNRTLTMGSTQFLTEMSIKNLPGGWG
jgi:hypothetical protein